ncbi:MAG: MBL fold metallo-hydrolase [Chitinophagales bacterium]|nr:MBL fold metallo-hydrolase [Chitinophagales bacterium]
MIKHKKFTFNPFSENTYVVYDDSDQCVIIDPGCYSPAEKEMLKDFINNNGLKPEKIINTHCHIDHILGLEFVADTWDLKTYFHEAEMSIYRSGSVTAMAYGIPFRQPDVPVEMIDMQSDISFGNSKFEILFTPGHSPGSVSLLHRESKSVFCGDVLFQNSIGRIDLPGADPSAMKETLMDKMMSLDDDINVYSGHGPDTSIGDERVSNPFIKQPNLIY